MDEKEVKDALDAFEKDDFITAKEKLSGQIKQAKNDFLKSKLGLKGDIEQQFVKKPVAGIDVVKPTTVDKKPRRVKDGTKG